MARSYGHVHTRTSISWKYHMPNFAVENVAIALGNRDYFKRPVLAEAQLVDGGRRHRVFVRPDGEVVFPSAFPCPQLRAAAATAVRRGVLDRLAVDFARHEGDAPVPAARPT